MIINKKDKFNIDNKNIIYKIQKNIINGNYKTKLIYNNYYDNTDSYSGTIKSNYINKFSFKINNNMTLKTIFNLNNYYGFNFIFKNNIYRYNLQKIIYYNDNYNDIFFKLNYNEYCIKMRYSNRLKDGKNINSKYFGIFYKGNIIDNSISYKIKFNLLDNNLSYLFKLYKLSLYNSSNRLTYNIKKNKLKFLKKQKINNDNYLFIKSNIFINNIYQNNNNNTINYLFGIKNINNYYNIIINNYFDIFSCFKFIKNDKIELILNFSTNINIFLNENRSRIGFFLKFNN